MTLALLTGTLAVLISVWTSAYCWTSTLPTLMWLDRARREDAWLDSIQSMHETLTELNLLEHR